MPVGPPPATITSNINPPSTVGWEILRHDPCLAAIPRVGYIVKLARRVLLAIRVFPGQNGDSMTSEQRPYGLTLPLAGIALHAQRELVASLPDLGYSDVWSAEAGGADAFTPLTLAAAWSPTLALGTAIVPAFTRGAATIAQSAAALADAAPGRFTLGLGTSSQIIVEDWNGIAFDRPYERVRDVVRFLRAALAGEKVTATYGTFMVRGFRLGLVPAVAPEILIAALRPGMLRLAGREADGAILNWLSADDVTTAVPHVHEAGPGKRIVARIFVCPTDDATVARRVAKTAIAGYLTVPAYRAFHEWLGRGPQLGPMWTAWAAGDRKGAVAAVPDEVADTLVLHGTPAQIKAGVRRYVENGVTVPVLAILPVPGEEPGAMADHVRALGGLWEGP
jgi:probable F420-dependent oxidoreductase